MREARSLECRNCGRTYPEDELDRARWCASCRTEVIRRASRWGRGVALLSAAAVAAWIAFVIAPSERFLIAWMALVAATYLFVANLVRRIAFEVIRSRGVPPAPK